MTYTFTHPLAAALLADQLSVVGSAGRFEVFDPATGEPVTTVARHGADDMIAAVGAANEAQPAWAATAPRRRSQVLSRAFELMQQYKEDLAQLICLEMGKPIAEARGEVQYAAEFFRWFAEEAVRVGGELRRAPSGSNNILTFRRPVGVCLLLTPWNFPAAMATRKIGPALAAGCAVVLKPAEDTPLTALFLAGLLTEAGVPPGVVNVVTTDRPGDIVPVALADVRVRKLSFTGSTAVGRRLLQQAAANVVNSSMELGGNAPFLVFADADVDAAVKGALLAKLRNGGQACTAANRFLVAESIAAEFADRLTAALASVQLGAGTDPKSELGPLINGRARDGLAERVERSIELGARVRTGGSIIDGPGWFYRPTVLVDVPRNAPVVTEETFGPVAPVVPFIDEDDAIALANASELGLSAYVYTGDLARGLRVAEQLEVGMVGLNRGLVSDPAAPFGGVKQSGLGREGGFEGIDAYLETTYAAVEW